MKKFAFTLGEVLVTLAVVGIVAIMTIPSMLQNLHNKSTIALAQTTIGELGKAVIKDLTTHDGEVTQADIKTNPENFFNNNFDVKKISKTTVNVSAKSMKGTTVNNSNLSNAYDVLLKNGVRIVTTGLSNNIEFDVYIYTNSGKEKADCIVGLENFKVKVFVKETNDTATYGFNRSAGDVVGGYLSANKTEEQKKDECYKGSYDYCLDLLTESGFDPDYMKGYKSGGS